MQDHAMNKHDRISHEVFASSLRSEMCNEPNSKDVIQMKYLNWINSMTELLTCENRKINLMRILHLTNITHYELDFFKASISILTSAARAYNITEYYDKYATALKKWANLPIRNEVSNKQINPDDLCGELYISREGFKNSLLKLLMNKSSDCRIGQMRRFFLEDSTDQSARLSNGSSKYNRGNSSKSGHKKKFSSNGGGIKYVVDLSPSLSTTLPSQPLNEGSVTGNSCMGDELVNSVIQNECTNANPMYYYDNTIPHISYIPPFESFLTTNIPQTISNEPQCYDQGQYFGTLSDMYWIDGFLPPEGYNFEIRRTG